MCYSVTAPALAGLDELDVFAQRAAGVGWWFGLPGGEAVLELFGGDFDVELEVVEVDFDGVAVLDGGDGAADCGFGAYVSDDGAVGAAGEASVGDEVDLLAEALSDECAGDGEHLSHAGSAFGAFVADDDDVASFDLSPLERGRDLLFLVEHLGWAGESSAELVSGDLEHAAIGCEVAVEHD